MHKFRSTCENPIVCAIYRIPKNGTSKYGTLNASNIFYSPNPNLKDRETEVCKILNISYFFWHSMDCLVISHISGNI